MKATFLLFMLSAVILGISLLANVIYRAIYQNRINRQLNNENYRAKKLLSPWSFLITTAFAVLLLFTVSMIFVAFNSGDESVPEQYRNAIYDYQTYGPDEMTGYRSLYSMDKNQGYTKATEQKGDILFTYFIRDDAFDYYHPSYVVFVEYTGDKKILYYGIQGEYFMLNDMSMGGNGHAGAEFKDYFCIIGTSSVECKIELTAYLYDSSLKSENMSDHAAASEILTIIIPPQVDDEIG